jgi:ATP-binding cassette, subfamily F, member 3
VLYRLDHVRVAFGPREVLADVSLQHNPGEKLVLVGRNGSGKTTILNVVGGEQEVESGRVERASAVEIGRVEQLLGSGGDLAVRDFCLRAFPRLVEVEAELSALEVALHGGSEEAAHRYHELHDEYDHLDGYRARPRVAAALEAVGLGPAFHDRIVETLSGGERTRVALVRALLSRSPLLLLDEPTNHLDLLGVEFLCRELAAREGAVLVVTHDRELIDRIGGEILELHGGRLERYSGGYARYRRERAARREQQRKAYELQRAEIERQQEFIRRNIAGQNTKQAQSRQKLLDRIERLPAPEPDLGTVRLRWPHLGRSGERVLECEDLAVGWDRPLLAGVTLTLRRNERLAVVGRNGSGKTTLLTTLAGKQAALGGRIRFGSGVVPGAYDQDHAEVPERVTVLAAVMAVRPDWTPAEGRAWAGRFGFSGTRADALTDTLSGGERARLALARLIAQGPNLLLLDEPTNHLDMPTCEALEEALTDYPGAVVLVSHDRRLVEQIATEVLLLDGGRAEPVNRVDEAFARIGLPSGKATPKGEQRSATPRRSAIEEERRRLRRDAARARELLAGLAADLERAEARLREIDELLCDRAVYSDHVQAAALAREGEELRQNRDDAMEAWVEAEDDAAALEARLAELAQEG